MLEPEDDTDGIVAETAFRVGTWISLKKISSPLKFTIGVLSDSVCVDFSPEGRSAVIVFTLTSVVITRK